MVKPQRAFDPTSAAPTLFYTGSGAVAGVPARDLSDNDLAHVAFARLSREDRPALAADVSDKALASLRDDLVALGAYATKPQED